MQGDIIIEVLIHWILRWSKLIWLLVFVAQQLILTEFIHTMFLVIVFSIFNTGRIVINGIFIMFLNCSAFVMYNTTIFNFRINLNCLINGDHAEWKDVFKNCSLEFFKLSGTLEGFIESFLKEIIQNDGSGFILKGIILFDHLPKSVALYLCVIVVQNKKFIPTSYSTVSNMIIIGFYQ